MIRYNPKGLTTPQIDESRRRHGDNVITPPKDDSAWRLLLEKFRDPIIRILLLAAVLSLIIGFVHKDFTESVGIICAIILATCVGFWFEWDAQRRFRRLNQVNDDIPVKVMREGSIREIPRRDVVTGDVVYIESGETIPADGELVEAVSLKINESTLTGEPEVDKTVNEADFDPEATYPSNAVLRGTTVADGYGVMVVTAVGDATEAGRVTEQSTVQSEEQTPLDRQLTRLSRLIGRLGILLSALIFCVMLGKAIFAGGLLESDWLTISQHVLQIFMVSVAIIVMAVPEGLPMSITLSLAMSMRRMLKTNNLVRKMHACETMGAVTVICTDKTGTLTQNRMHVQELIRYDTLPAREFAEVVALNTTAFLDAEGHIIGNPTEGALLEWMRAGGEDYEPLRAEAKIVNRLTFSTERKYMATIIESGISGRRILCVKGAPEIVRTMCAPDGKDAQVAEQLLGFQSRAMRTLAVAWAETASDDCLEAVKAGGLHFAAVAAISDPVREDVPAAVARCLEAGIGIKIVTGDTPATAREIARQIGLWNDAADGERNHITGTEFAAMSDEELLGRVQELKIMSRARPLDKQRLVKLLQQRGEVVAVTGDGTNDAPALNFANVGLSMGSGTSVAKDASDITLLDDSFASIATAVMWGRSLYRNIQFRAVPADDQLRGHHHLLHRRVVRNRHAAHGGADSLGEHHHGHLRGDGHGLAAAQPRSDARQTAPEGRIHHHPRHGPHPLHVRRGDGGRTAGNALPVDDPARRTHGGATDRVLLDVRLPPVLEHVQRQGIRDAPFGLHMSRRLPRILPDPRGDRRGTGADRGIRRRGVPHRTALVDAMGRGDRIHLAAGCRRRNHPCNPQKKKTVAIIGTGLSATYLATQNLGVRFSTDYDVAPPVVRSSRERLHKLTFSMEVCAVF